ncbi:MAG: hypothetical protein AAGU27_15005 [Dehalobacterium sp.]
MSKKHKKHKKRVEFVEKNCGCNRGIFDQIICLIIVLIVLEFLCVILAGEIEDGC